MEEKKTSTELYGKIQTVIDELDDSFFSGKGKQKIPEIVFAINKRKHIRVIDWKYRVLTAFWRRIPRWLWRRFKL